MRCLAKCFPLCVTPVVVPRCREPNPLTFWQKPTSAGKNKSKSKCFSRQTQKTNSTVLFVPSSQVPSSCFTSYKAFFCSSKFFAFLNLTKFVIATCHKHLHIPRPTLCLVMLL